METAIGILVSSVFGLLMTYAFMRANSSGLTGRCRRLIVLGGFGFAVGIALVVLNSIQLWRGFQSRHWPTVGGIITESIYKSGWRPTWNGFTDYQHGKISYQYNVDGTNYVSHQLTIADRGLIVTGDLAEYVRNHWKGDDIIVHFNGQNPQEAVLLPGPDFGNHLGVFLGLMTAAAGLALCFRPQFSGQPKR